MLTDQQEVQKYQPTQLGSAVLASSMSPDEGLAVFAELQKARQCFVLANELHIIYLVRLAFFLGFVFISLFLLLLCVYVGVCVGVVVVVERGSFMPSFSSPFLFLLMMTGAVRRSWVTWTGTDWLCV